ncbi:MAG: apolipoprotein N-acyltransferase [Pseudomonadota bacterium]
MSAGHLALTRRWNEARLWQRLIGVAVLGGFAALGHAPWGAWPVTIVTLALVYGAFRQTTTTRDAAILGCAAGTGYFIVALSWIVEPFLVDPLRHGWMAPFAVTLLSFYLAWYWALAFGLARRLGGGVAAFLGATILGETLRAVLFTGFPWAQVGHILIETPLLYWASWGGALFLNLMVWGVSVALFHLLNRVTAVPVLGLILAGLAYVSAPFLMPGNAPGSDAPIVRVIQPNAPQNEKWAPDKMLGFYERQIGFTSAQGRGPRPDVVVWPETAVPFLLSESGPARQRIADAALGAPVVLGLRRYDGPRIYNSLIATDRNGEVTALYDKHHLVPFGEFVPFGNLMARIGIGGLASENGLGFSAGPGPQVIDLGPLGRAAPLICYEGVFARNLLGTPERPDLILMITNDAWFGDISGPYQHLAQGRLRAVEQGLPMVRSANTGISAVIDGAGRILTSIPLGEAGFADAALPPPLPPTFYSRTGDWPMLILMGLLLMAAPLRARLSVQDNN